MNGKLVLILIVLGYLLLRDQEAKAAAKVEAKPESSTEAPEAKAESGTVAAESEVLEMRSGFYADVEDLINAGLVPRPPEPDPFAPIAAIYPPQEDYWTGEKWILKSPGMEA